MDRLICNIYHPFIDDDNTLIGMDFGDNYEKSLLKISKDFGETWTTVFDFSTVCDGIARPPIFGMIYVSISGYVFVGLKNKHTTGVGYLYRSKSPREIGKYNNLDFSLVKTYSEGCFLNPWQFTEDELGNLYTGLYNTPSVIQNHALIYKSLDDGNTWTLIKDFSNSHIHSLYYDLYNKTLYATTGDNGKYTYISTDKGTTFTKISGTGNALQPIGGDTGMAFFEGCWVGGSDFVPDNNTEETSQGYSNYIKKTVGVGISQSYKKVLNLTQNPYNTAFYDIHSWGGSVAFAVTQDEWDSTLTKCSSLWFTKDTGETWSLVDECPNGSKAPIFVGIACGRNSRIPSNFPYVIVNNHYTRESLYPREGAMGLCRYSIDEILNSDRDGDTYVKTLRFRGLKN